MNFTLIKKPSAFVPIGMSLAGLFLVIGHFAVYGIVHEADEGTPAHLFQILMVAQVPFVIYFAAKWLPRAPAKAIPVLFLHGIAMFMAFAAVFFLT